MILVLLLVSIATTACGKKGSPLPPLRRVPAAVADLAAERYADEVFVRFTVPTTNVEGPGAANLTHMEIYAITTERPIATDQLQTEALRQLATLVASEAVREPLPPPSSAEPGRPTPPAPTREPGLDQGAEAVVRDVLAGAALETVSVAPEASPTPASGVSAPLPYGPLVAPDATTGPRRHYFAVGVAANGRYGQTSRPVSVPLGRPAGAPAAVEVTYDERSFAVRWSPSPDARTADSSASGEGLLLSRPLAAPEPPTRYDVYGVEPTSQPPTGPVAPDALNDKPIAATEFRVPGVTFGRERCFGVRSVDMVAETAIRGPLSAPACVTPTDTFPPAPPRNLQAVAGAGTISLIWEASEESDLAGYIVLRGEAPGDTLTPLTRNPIREPRFDDTTVKAGVRYVYAVVAVDGESRPNASAPSNRAEETARQ